MRANPIAVRFEDAVRVASHYFGKPRRRGGSHVVWKMPWPLDPRVNLQRDSNGKAKAYQVRQLLEAINRLSQQRTAKGPEAAEADPGAFRVRREEEEEVVMPPKLQDQYTYRVSWSPEDEEFVATCEEFPSLSWLATNDEAALRGIKSVVAGVLGDMRQAGEQIPAPIASRESSAASSRCG